MTDKRRMKTQPIRAKPRLRDPRFTLGGWLGSQPSQTYLWFGYDDKCVGILSDKALYRLAKAIVKRFEQDA